MGNVIHILRTGSSMRECNRIIEHFTDIWKLSVIKMLSWLEAVITDFPRLSIQFFCIIHTPLS